MSHSASVVLAVCLLSQCCMCACMCVFPQFSRAMHAYLCGSHTQWGIFSYQNFSLCARVRAIMPRDSLLCAGDRFRETSNLLQQ